MAYKDEYAVQFLENCKSFYPSNRKLKSIIKKAINSILVDPYVGTKYIEELGCRRKHVGGKKFRIFYNIFEKEKKVVFYYLRAKDKNTYK